LIDVQKEIFSSPLEARVDIDTGILSLKTLSLAVI